MLDAYPGELACVAPNAAESNPSDAPDPAIAGPAAACRANARTIDSGSQSPLGWRAPTWASRALAVGRCRWSLSRQRSISGRTSAGSWSRLGMPWTTRYSIAAVVPVPNGPWPVAAKARTAPRLSAWIRDGLPGLAVPVGDGESQVE